MKIYTIAVALMCLITYGIPSRALSSTRGITVTIQNKTPQEFIVKLVNLESSQEVLIEILNAEGKGRDIIKMAVPPELYGITIYHPPTDKVTRINAKALRSILLPGSACAGIVLRPRIYVGEPQIELSSSPTC